MAFRPARAQPESSAMPVMRHAAARSPLPLRLKRAMHSSALLGLRVIFGDFYRKWVFAKIWSENRWGDAESRSGGGSNLRQTEHLRRDLAELLASLRVRSLLDLPCGDFHWMKEVPLPPETLYVGGDIVEPLVERNRTQFGSELRQFRTIDLMCDPLPAVDLILCRDALVHFSFGDIFAAIANFKRSGTEYLLTTHYSGDRKNHNIRTGQWRPLNLTGAPFHFPLPVLLIDEQCTERNGDCRDKCLGLWRLKDLPEQF